MGSLGVRRTAQAYREEAAVSEHERPGDDPTRRIPPDEAAGAGGWDEDATRRIDPSQEPTRVEPGPPPTDPTQQAYADPWYGEPEAEEVEEEPLEEEARGVTRGRAALYSLATFALGFVVALFLVAAFGEDPAVEDEADAERIAELEEEVAERDEEIAALEGQLEDQEAELEAARDALDDADADLAEAREALDERAAALDDRESQLDERAAGLDERAAELDEREAAIEQRETALAEAEEDDDVDLDDIDLPDVEIDEEQAQNIIDRVIEGIRDLLP